MSKQPHHNAPQGYIRVATAAHLLARSREWVYKLIEEKKIESADLIVEGRGFRPLRLVKLESFIAYVRDSDQYQGQRTAILNRARAEATKITVRDFTEEDRAVMERRYAENDGLEEIARDYKSSAGTIGAILTARGVKMRMPKDRYQENREEFAKSLEASVRDKIVSLHQAGEGPAAIAEKIGWGRGQHGKVKRVLLGLGHQLRSRSEAQQIAWSRRTPADTQGESIHEETELATA